MCVRPDQIVRTQWIDIDQAKLGSRVPMAVASLEKKAQKLINLGPDVAPWPPIVGHWSDDRFVVWDGRHEYLSSLMLGRERLFVCWLEAAEPSPDSVLVGEHLGS